MTSLWAWMGVVLAWAFAVCALLAIGEVWVDRKDRQ